MRFLTGAPSNDLTYSDVFMVPRRSAVTSRLDVDLTSADGVGTTLPLVVANMTAISGRRMAETVARRGGVAIIPQDIPTDVVASSVRKVKASHPVFDTPVSVAPHATVGEAMSLLPKRAHGLAVVVEDGRPIGTVSEAEAAGVDRFAQVHEVMSSDLLVVSPDRSPREIFDELAAHHLERRAGGRRRPAGRGDDPEARAALDPLPPGAGRRRRLIIGAAVGINGDVAGRAEQLLGERHRRARGRHGARPPGEDDQALKSVREVRDRWSDDRGRRVPLVAGNVVSADGVTRPGRGRRGRDQGRRRTGGDVHDADDDRGRPAPVQCGARVRGGRPRAGQVDLGRRRRPLSARRRAGAGRRRRQS